MYRAQVICVDVIHILIRIILQIRCGYTVPVRSHHKLIVCVSTVNVVHIQTWLPVVLLRIPIPPVSIPVIMLPPRISRVHRSCRKLSHIYMICQFIHISKWI